MGTSKGYIAPSTPEWSQAKRAVSQYVTSSSSVDIACAAERYASAMLSNNAHFSSAAQSFSGAISFAASCAKHGFASALIEIGREDILDLPPDEAINELIHYFSNDGSTIDDKIAIDCISECFEVLEITELEDIESINTTRFLAELVCQFAKIKFVQLFDKQIRNKCPNIIEANARIREMQEYIYYTIKEKLTDNVIQRINPTNLANEKIVQSVIREGYELMISVYGE